MYFTKSKIFKSSIIALPLFGLVWGAVYQFENYYTPHYKYQNIKQNNGIYQEFYPNGKLKTFEEYENGQKNGLSFGLNDEGDTTFKYSYFKGMRHGRFEYFSKGGELFRMQVYNQDLMIQDTILNDSIYRFEYLAIETSRSLFDMNCADCHVSIKEIIDFNNTNFSLIKMDSIHLCMMDTLLDTKVEKRYLQLSLSEFEAILFHIENIKKDYEIQQKIRKSPQWYRKKIVNSKSNR